MPAERDPQIKAPNEPVEFINLLEVPADELDQFLTDWKRRSHVMEDAAGFISDELEQSLIEGSKYRLINISRWPSYNVWLEATNNPAYIEAFKADNAAHPSQALHLQVTRGLYRPVAASRHVYD